MSRTLILHIGAPKCGSTYLQQVLLSNRAELSASGTAYPHAGQSHPGNGLAALDMTPQKLEALFEGHDRLFLSHEDLFAAAARTHLLADMASGARIRVQVIAFLRPFSAFIFGDYSQFIKQHLKRFITEGRAFEGRSFEQFAVERSRAINVNGFLKVWARLFPERPVILASHKLIRAEIEPLLASPHLNWVVPNDRANPSLRMQDCDAITTAINTHAPAAEIRAMLRDALKNTGLPDAGRSAERIAWIEALFAKQNHDLRATFGFDNRLPQFRKDAA